MAPGLVSLGISIAAVATLAKWALPAPDQDGGNDDDDTGDALNLLILRAAWAATALLHASLFANPPWRILCTILAAVAGHFLSLDCTPLTILSLFVLCVKMPHSLRGPSQPARGVVFVTGADSGMGYHSAIRLAKAGYHVVAGCYLHKESDAKLKAELSELDDESAPEMKRLTTVQLDVTSDESVKAAVDVVKSHPEYGTLGLVGVINCAGVGYNGPAEYFPLSMYRAQMEVNCFGYIRIAQAFTPLLRSSAATDGARRGRLVFFGTGGGPCSPVPPLLSAYMASKFAIEAFAMSLRLEMQLTEQPIDVCMVNPGFIKPTNLMAGGMELTRKMWAECAKMNGDDRAEEEYGALLKQFVKFSEEQPGTHVGVVAETVERLMAAPRPLTSYKVGEDSIAAPFVGMMPTGVREFIVKTSMFGERGAV